MKASNRWRRGLGVGVLAMLVASCNGPKSSSTSGPGGGPVPTHRITMTLVVESATPDRAVVRANLSDGRATGASYRLDGGDYLRACLDGVCRSMADNDSVFTPDYIARFDYQANTDYVVSFNRLEARNAPDSRVVLPPPFAIVTPVDHQPVSDGDTVLLSWSPSGAPARVVLNYEAECTTIGGQTNFSVGSLTADSRTPGRAVVPVNPIVSFARVGSLAPVRSCSIDLIVRHELDGHVDPAFDRGTAVGVVLRQVTLDYTPR